MSTHGRAHEPSSSHTKNVPLFIHSPGALFTSFDTDAWRTSPQARANVATVIVFVMSLIVSAWQRSVSALLVGSMMIVALLLVADVQPSDSSAGHVSARLMHHTPVSTSGTATKTVQVVQPREHSRAPQYTTKSQDMDMGFPGYGPPMLTERPNYPQNAWLQQYGVGTPGVEETSVPALYRDTDEAEMARRQTYQNALDIQRPQPDVKPGMQYLTVEAGHGSSQLAAMYL